MSSGEKGLNVKKLRKLACNKSNRTERDKLDIGKRKADEGVTLMNVHRMMKRNKDDGTSDSATYDEQ